MNTPTVLSDCSSRHRHRKKGSSSSSKRALVLHSDHHSLEEIIGDVKETTVIPSRPSSAHNHHVLRVPRMAQLETLEAKMANIEVSLSTNTPRRRKSGSLGGPGRPQRDLNAKDDTQRIQPKDGNKENPTQPSAAKDHHQQQTTEPSPPSSRCPQEVPLTEEDRLKTEETTANLLKDVEAKRAAIKNLKLSLDRLDITDNIDVRIQQAELEYQLGREELELLTLLEQSRALQLLLEQDDHAKTKQDQQTIYSCVANEPETVSLHAIRVEFDAKSPQFGAGPRQRQAGLWLEWALEHTGMRRGDRLMEVNGKLVLSKSKDDMVRLLSISPSPAHMVVMRSAANVSNFHEKATKSLLLNGQVDPLRVEMDALREQAEETKRSKEGLRSDNLRLTHRISYLEEQVADLLERNKLHNFDPTFVVPQKMMTSTVKTQRNVTNISITSDPPPNPNPKPSPAKADVQVFQKGPDVTALVANLPGLEVGSKDTAEASANLPVLVRPRSSQSNVSSTHIEIKTNHHQHHQQHLVNHRHLKNGRLSLQPSRSSDFLSQGEEDNASNRSQHQQQQYGLRQSMSHHAIYNKDQRRTFDYNTETSAALEIIKNNERQYANETNSRKDRKARILGDDHSDTSKGSHEIMQLLKNIENNSKWNKDEYSDFNPDRDYIDHRIDGKMIQNAHKSNRRTSSKKGQDCDSEPGGKTPKEDKYRKSRTKLIDYTSEPDGYSKRTNGPRPLPPKKPVRLSLHRAQSMQTIEPEIVTQHHHHHHHQSEKFYLHNPSERSKPHSLKNTDEIRYTITKNTIDDMVHYDKENKSRDYESYSEDYVKRLKEHSRSEELIDNKRIKKRPHEELSIYNGKTKNELSSKVDKYNSQPCIVNGGGGVGEEYNSSKSKHLNGTARNGDVVSSKSSSSIVSSFKWSSPSIFKNIRIDGSSRSVVSNSENSKK